jgi:membrane-associated phospholipid phosphatase
LANLLEHAARVTRLRWWVEVLIIGAFYGVYSVIRNLHAAGTHNLVRATHNAYRIVRFERDLHIFAEASVQHAFVHDRLFILALDDYYGIAHFVAVIGVLIWLFFARREHYARWRNTLALCTAAALAGYAFFPVLPPRLLPAAQFHIVDTLKVVGGLWNFSSGPTNRVTDQYAAMPSLHTAWSTWCALAVGSACKTKRAKIAVLAYPALTIFCIVVTGNHYFSDAAGGLVTLALSYLVVHYVTLGWERLQRPQAHPGIRLSGQPSIRTESHV